MVDSILQDISSLKEESDYWEEDLPKIDKENMNMNDRQNQL
jgi:hypothetical protein